MRSVFYVKQWVKIAQVTIVVINEIISKFGDERHI